MNVRIFLLVGGLAVVSYSEGAVIDPEFCGAKQGQFCENCLQPVQCDGAGNLTELPPCSSGTACSENGGLATCKPQDQTICTCQATGDQCDAYNSNYLMKCLGTGPYDVAACPTAGYVCMSGECHDGSSPCATVTTPPSWVLIKPSCTDAVYCTSATEISANIHCEAGQYVDYLGDCRHAPPKSCDGSCTDGICPNPLDCTKIDTCNQGTLIDTQACPSGTSYDPEAPGCVPEANNDNCPITEGCDFENVDPVDPDYPLPDCNQSTVGSYPVAACSQEYKSCRKVSDGVYAYFPGQCLSDLYFDPVTRYCIHKKDIDSCT